MVSEVKELKPEHNADTVNVAFLTNFGFLDRFTIFCIFGTFTNGCVWAPSLTENHKTLSNLCYLDKEMDLMEEISQN